MTLSSEVRLVYICSGTSGLTENNDQTLHSIIAQHIDNVLTHWGPVMHICVSKLTINGLDNGFSPGRRQAIIWTNAGILLMGPLGTSVDEILIKIHTFSIKKLFLIISSGKWRPFYLGLNVLRSLHNARHSSGFIISGIRYISFSLKWHRIISWM